jgi:hypothetical protein
MSTDPEWTSGQARRRAQNDQEREKECACHLCCSCGHEDHEHHGAHRCGECHRCQDVCGCRQVTVRVRVECEDADAGRPGKPGPECPPPQSKQPGIEDVPQNRPPYHPPVTGEPPWRSGRPPVGSPGELPWFRGKIGEISRKGPTFGPRKDEFLPYLVMRATSGDRGGRPLNGVFWESPDIYVVPNQPADNAPLRPATQGGVAQANVPNTLYAHIWNLGKSPVYRVRVEFWWFDPSLGFSRGAGNFVGAAYLDLGDRFTLYEDWTEVSGPAGAWVSRGCHAIVRCPQTWVPTYLNNGHECLVVRVGDTLFDPVAPQSFSPAADRHVGQRNIAVVQAASPAELSLDLDLGWFPRPGQAVVDVITEPPGSMEWLQLYVGTRAPGLRAPAAATTAGLLAPHPDGTDAIDIAALPVECRGPLLRPHTRFARGCDPLRVPLYALAADLRPGEAQVLRVRQRLDGTLIGGYTVAIVGPRP